MPLLESECWGRSAGLSSIAPRASPGALNQSTPAPQHQTALFTHCRRRVKRPARGGGARGEHMREVFASVTRAEQRKDKKKMKQKKQNKRKKERKNGRNTHAIKNGRGKQGLLLHIFLAHSLSLLTPSCTPPPLAHSLTIPLCQPSTRTCTRAAMPVVVGCGRRQEWC